jgi:hypothetical protein
MFTATIEAGQRQTAQLVSQLAAKMDAMHAQMNAMHAQMNAMHADVRAAAGSEVEHPTIMKRAELEVEVAEPQRVTTDHAQAEPHSTIPDVAAAAAVAAEQAGERVSIDSVPVAGIANDDLEHSHEREHDAKPEHDDVQASIDQHIDVHEHVHDNAAVFDIVPEHSVLDTAFIDNYFRSATADFTRKYQRKWSTFLRKPRATYTMVTAYQLWCMRAHEHRGIRAVPDGFDAARRIPWHEIAAGPVPGPGPPWRHHRAGKRTLYARTIDSCLH